MKFVFRLTAVRAATVLFLLSMVSSGQAQSKTNQTLSFDVTANAVRAGSKSAVQAMDARVHLRGERVRVETRLGSQNLVVLMVRPYVYRLLPGSKAGVRYKSSTPLPQMGALVSGWQELMAQPQKLRAALGQKGARKIGSTTLGGTKADIYSADKWEGKPRKVKLWIRSNDSLPLRMETLTGGAKLTLNWKNYRRGHALSPSLFAVPKNYHIRDGQMPQEMKL